MVDCGSAPGRLPALLFPQDASSRKYVPIFVCSERYSTVLLVQYCMNTVPASTTASTMVGYARVSTVGQTLEQQSEALTAAGAGKIFHDVMSGARDDRPGFAECMRYLREGDTLIVWRLDRLGRNMRSIINTLHELTERGVTVRS